MPPWVSQLLSWLPQGPPTAAVVLLIAAVTVVVSVTSAGLAAVVAIRIGTRNRSVQALLETYKWYREGDETAFRLRLLTGNLRDDPLTSYIVNFNDPTAQLLRDYLGRMEFRAILVRYRLVDRAPAEAIYDTGPSQTLEHAREYIAHRRHSARNYCRYLEEWVALQKRGTIARRIVPEGIYCLWYRHSNNAIKPKSPSAAVAVDSETVADPSAETG